MVEHDTNGKSPSGRTWGEIAQARDEKLRRANEALSLMGDQEARWWWYACGHCTFELVVGEPCARNNPWSELTKGNVVLSMSGCDYIGGPVSWPNQRLRIEYRPDVRGVHGNTVYELIDREVGFRVVAASFTWALDYDLVSYRQRHFDLCPSI